ncbi:MAG: putative rhamnosyl transferase [Flaviramulus sp.]|nr:putative rhamnosyl transferase [Flaviramulus sp.]
MFKHYLITRFNLRKTDWTLSKQNESVLTDTWLENRFKLFLDYCFPSVASQNNLNFEWLVYFDITTPDYYKEKIKNLENELTLFKPIFVNGIEEFLPNLQNYITINSGGYVITSGLDNDDCLSTNYINEVQKQFNKQDYLALDFIDGYTLQVNDKIRIGKKKHQFNPFLSLIEKNDNPKSMYHREHMHWKYEKKLKTIKNKVIWASIIHQENMVNEFTGFDNIDIQLFFENFKISEQKKAFILKHIVNYKKWRFESYLNKLDSYRNVYYKNIKRKLGLYKE